MPCRRAAAARQQQASAELADDRPDSRAGFNETGQQQQAAAGRRSTGLVFRGCGLQQPQQAAAGRRSTGLVNLRAGFTAVEEERRG